jgi:cellulose synthase/poly-beta-1,6-N-acetylglucosamine synthase-like glycosyltransferase
MLTTVLYILFTLAFAYTALSVLYLFMLSLWGNLFYRLPYSKIEMTPPQKRIAVLVPAYKEDGIIYATAQNLLRQNYPESYYDIYIIADSFKPATIKQLSQLPVHILEVSFDKSTKTKSLNEAFGRIQKPYDIALICDADNMLARNFLQKINHAFVNGAKAVQGRRVAKNLDTSFSILDACSEGINNNIFRKGANAIGLSSAVIGSGMAFGYEELKQIMSNVNAVGGFDKILQLKVVEQHKIIYLEDALIFDEKVENPHAFQQQRRRWVSSQFIYLKQFFLPAMKQLFKGNVSYFNLAIANNLVLPRAFLFMLVPLLLVCSLFFGVKWLLASCLVTALYTLSLLLAMPKELVNKDLAKAVLQLPRAVMMMVSTLFGMKKANKTFIHTIHTKTEISNPLFHEHSK